MTFFPNTLYINPFNSTFTEKPAGNITENMPDTAYRLMSSKGCRAVYKYKNTQVIIVAKGLSYVAVY